MAEVNKFEVQQMYDASKEIPKQQNPLSSYDANSGNIIFKNEYERKMFLVGLDLKKLDAAITTLKKSENEIGLSDTEKADYLKVLTELRNKLDDNKRNTRAALHNEPWVIDAAIPGPKWGKNDKGVTVEGKNYGVEKREGSEVGKSDLKIDIGLLGSVVIKDVPNDQIDAVLKLYETANRDVTGNSPLKSGTFGKTVQYDQISNLISVAPAPMKAVVEDVNVLIDLSKEGWTLNKDNKLEKDGKLFNGKGKFVKEGKDGNIEEGSYQKGVLTDGHVQWNNGKKRLDGKFANDSKVTYLTDGAFTTEEGEVRKGKWKKEGENYIFTGTITSADGKKTTKWENGKEKDGKKVEEKKPEAIISDDQLKELGNVLSDGKKTTSTVRKNSKEIIDALKTGTKLPDVKNIIANLQDQNAKIIDFQNLLGRTQDGTIGSGDILALLQKAGVPEDKIPQVIKDKAGKEQKPAPAAAAPAPDTEALLEAQKIANERWSKIKALRESLVEDTGNKMLFMKTPGKSDDSFIKGPSSGSDVVFAQLVSKNAPTIVWGELEGDTRPITLLNNEREITAMLSIKKGGITTRHYVTDGVKDLIPLIGFNPTSAQMRLIRPS